MKIKYISEGFFKTSAQMKKQIEKEQSTSDEEIISSVANETIFNPIVKTVNEEYYDYLLDRFGDVVAVAVDSHLNKSIKPYFGVHYDTCSDRRQSMIVYKRREQDSWTPGEFEKFVLNLGNELGSKLKFLMPVRWSQKSNAEGHIADIISQSKGTISNTTYSFSSVDDAMSNDEFCNIVKSDKRLMLVKFYGRYPFCSYISENKDTYSPMTGFKIDLYVIATGHDLDPKGMKEYQKIIAKYEINDRDPEIDSYFINLFKEVANGTESAIPSDIKAIKESLEKCLVECIYNDFIRKSEDQQECPPFIANKIKELFPIAVNLTICRAVMIEHPDGIVDVRDKDRNIVSLSPNAIFIPIKGMNKYSV